MLTLAPRTILMPSPLDQSQTHPALGPRRARVALLTGCAQQVLAPQINEATIRLLTRLGVEVVVARGAGCCGSLNHHMGQHNAAMTFARAINASGCGTTVKDYGFMFREEPEPFRSRSAKVANLAVDISEFLVRIGYAPIRPKPNLTVAYHSACSLQHGQKVVTEPKSLLLSAGFRVVEPAEPHLCCGSAGTYNIMQPAIAERLRVRKLGNLRAKQPDLIAAGNIGCITQLSGDGIPVVHTIELLDWMAGGPAPAGIEVPL
jgi:glycolate oxidase iron-sulfur subunit